MEWVETTGRTVAEALDAALDQLGVAEDEVEYEVIDEPRGGLLRRKEARIRARVKPLSREKPGERRRRERRPRSSGSRPGGRGRGGDRGGDAAGTEKTAASGNGGDRSERGQSGRGRSRGRRRGGRPAQPAGRPAANEGARREEMRVEETDVPIEEQAETAETFTRGLVEAFGAPAQVGSRIEGEDTVLVEVEGDDLGLLVGPRGVTLGAIEELVRTVVLRQTGGHGARIHVDVGGYRAKRREALREFTRDLATKVLDSGKDQALEPMSASDRKVVHDAVAEIDGVTTGSEGEEPRRRVVIRTD